MKHQQISLWIRSLLAFISGVLFATSFAPINWVYFSYLSPALLAYFWLQSSAKDNFIIGLAFGLGLYLFGISWVYVSLHLYGGMPVWMGGASVVLFALVLALFIAIPGYLLARLFPHNRNFRLLAVPHLWLLFEWTKSWIFTGFPWLEAGLSQTSTPLFAFAPIGGVYLVGWLTLLIATCLVGFVCHQGSVRHFYLSGLIMIALVSWFVNQINWLNPSAHSVTVGVVQGNVPIEAKWLPESRDKIIDKYVNLSQQLQLQASPELIIWPETALPLYTSHVDNTFWRAIQPKGTAVLTGVIDYGEDGQVFNAAVLACDNQQQTYRKRHLVPFGEYLPLRFLFSWVLDYLQLPMTDFSAWSGKQPLNCGEGIKIALSICYEDAFSEELRQHLGDANIIVNISEDAWFGNSFAPHQRVQIAQMRARELARPLIRSANTGPSVVIDALGDVQSSSAQFQAALLNDRVQTNDILTPYARFGSWIVLFSTLLLIILFLVYGRKVK